MPNQNHPTLPSTTDSSENHLLAACRTAVSAQDFVCKIEKAYGPYNTLSPRLFEDDAEEKDTYGRCFLHHLSLNQNLLDTYDLENDNISSANGDPSFIELVTKVLLVANPSALICEDDDFFFPFERTLTEWVEQVHGQSTSQSTAIPIGSPAVSSNSSDSDRDHTFQVSRRVKAALFLLSSILDHMDEDQQRTSKKRKPVSIGSALFLDQESSCRNSFYDPNKNDSNNNTNATNGSNNIRDSEIITRLAKIQDLLKTIVLLQNYEDWCWMLDCTTIRLIMMREESVGEWLVDILKSESLTERDCAIEYLIALSTIFDEEKEKSIGSVRTVICRQFRKLTKKMRSLHGLIPSISALDKVTASQVASTSVIEVVLDKVMTKTSSLALVYFDTVFLIMLLFSFRKSVHGYLVLPRDQYDEWMVWVQVTHACTFFFFVRFLMKSMSMWYKMKTHFLLKMLVGNIFNFIDVVGLVMAMISVTVMRWTFDDFQLGQNNQVEQFTLAATTWILWLKWAGIIQGLHEKAAFYVHAFWEITKDVLWFTVLLLFHGWCFQQVVYTMLVPKECREDNSSEDCDPGEYFLKVYAIMLGELIDRDDFGSMLSVIGFVVFSFVVTILLLNILIAVISDSYEKCLLNSGSFFAYARMIVVTEILIFQAIFGGTKKGQQRWEDGLCFFRVIVSCATLLWVVIEISWHVNVGGSVLHSVLSILIATPVTYFAVAMVSLPGRMKKVFKFMFKPMKLLLKYRLITRVKYDDCNDADGTRWRGRVRRVESQIKKSEAKIIKKIDASERRYRDMMKKKSM